VVEVDCWPVALDCKREEWDIDSEEMRCFDRGGWKGWNSSYCLVGVVVIAKTKTPSDLHQTTFGSSYRVRGHSPSRSIGHRWRTVHHVTRRRTVSRCRYPLPIPHHRSIAEMSRRRFSRPGHGKSYSMNEEEGENYASARNLAEYRRR
jgi:hypothetical protein